MDLRDQHFQPFDDLHDGEAGEHSAAEPPLASERLRRDVDRITGKIDRVVKARPKKKRPLADPIRIINLCLVILTLSTVIGFITWYRTQSTIRRALKTAPAVTRSTRNDLQHPVTPALPAPAQPQMAEYDPHRERVVDSSTMPRPQPEQPVTAPPAPALVRTPAAAPRTQPPASRSVPSAPVRQRSSSAPVRPAVPPTDAPADDDEIDTDRRIAFYEPVIQTGRTSGRSTKAVQTAPATTIRPKVIRMTSLLAETAGGQLDKILEHNGTYYKIRLTLPIKRIESFKRALAAQDHIATLSVTAAESTSVDMTAVILEINSR